MEGQSLERLFAGTTIDIPKMLAHLRQVADSLGLPFGDRKMTYNSRFAQELGLWAETKGCGDDFHIAAFHAYFAEGRNLAEQEVLLEIAAKAGLDRLSAEHVLAERSYSDQVDAHWQLSREKSVTAVPTFIIGNTSLTGARPYSDLVNLVLQAGEQVAKKE